MRVKKTGVSIPEDVLKKLDEFMKAAGIRSRSKVIADALNQYLAEREYLQHNREIIGVIVLLYDHSRGDTVKRVVAAQHNYVRHSFFTAHVHLSKEMCLEVIIIRGMSHEILKLSAELEEIPGVELVRVIPILPPED